MSAIDKAIAGIRSVAANAMWAARVFVQAGSAAKASDQVFSAAGGNMAQVASRMKTAVEAIAAARVTASSSMQSSGNVSGVVTWGTSTSSQNQQKTVELSSVTGG